MYRPGAPVITPKWVCPAQFFFSLFIFWTFCFSTSYFFTWSSMMVFFLVIMVFNRSFQIMFSTPTGHNGAILRFYHIFAAWSFFTSAKNPHTFGTDIVFFELNQDNPHPNMRSIESPWFPPMIPSIPASLSTSSPSPSRSLSPPKHHLFPKCFLLLLQCKINKNFKREGEPSINVQNVDIRLTVLNNSIFPPISRPCIALSFWRNDDVECYSKIPTCHFFSSGLQEQF